MADSNSSTALVIPDSKKGALAELMASQGDLALYNAAMDENVSAASVRHARLAIVQPGTPEVTEGIPGYKAGMLMTNTEKAVISRYCKMPWLLQQPGVKEDDVPLANVLECLVVFKLPDEYIAWTRREERKEDEGLWKFKTLIRTKDVLDGLPDWRGGKWKKSDQQPSPPVTENCNLLLVPLNADGNFLMGPIVASFSRTSFKTGEKLVNACRQHRHMNLPWHGMTYWLYTEFRSEEKGKYWRLRYARGRSLTDLPDWREKNKACIDICRALCDPAATEQKYEDGKLKGQFKSLGRVRQEQLISAAVLGDESHDDHEDEAGGDDSFTKDHFTGEAGDATDDFLKS